MLPNLNLCCIQAKSKTSNGEKEAEKSARFDNSQTRCNQHNFFSRLYDATQAKEEESNEAERDHLEDLPLPSWWLEDKVDQPEKYKQVPQNPGFNDDDAYDDNPPFSQEQISWFGMSRIVTGISA